MSEMSEAVGHACLRAQPGEGRRAVKGGREAVARTGGLELAHVGVDERVAGLPVLRGKSSGVGRDSRREQSVRHRRDLRFRGEDTAAARAHAGRAFRAREQQRLFRATGRKRRRRGGNENSRRHLPALEGVGRGRVRLGVAPRPAAPGEAAEVEERVASAPEEEPEPVAPEQLEDDPARRKIGGGSAE